jgi:hypothetical protein
MTERVELSDIVNFLGAGPVNHGDFGVSLQPVGVFSFWKVNGDTGNRHGVPRLRLVAEVFSLIGVDERRNLGAAGIAFYSRSN